MEFFFHNIFYANSEEITWWSMAFRGIFFYLLTILYIKIGGKRMFSSYGSFDIVISIMLGALLAKAIEGSAKFIPVLVTSFLMVFLHRILARFSIQHNIIGVFIKGESTLLVKEGKMLMDEMKQNNISREDIFEAMRLQKLADLTMVKEGYLERNGRISFILDKQPV